MAMLVLVADIDPVASLTSETAQRLAEVGVTSVAIAADDTTQAVVLEGWAFDPAVTGEQATLALGLGLQRILRPVLQTLLPLPPAPTSVREGMS